MVPTAAVTPPELAPEEVISENDGGAAEGVGGAVNPQPKGRPCPDGLGEDRGAATWDLLTAEEEMANGYNLEGDAWDEETSPPQYQWTPEMPYPQYPQGPTSEAPSTVPSPRERERSQGKYARPLPILQPSCCGLKQQLEYASTGSQC